VTSQFKENTTLGGEKVKEGKVDKKNECSMIKKANSEGGGGAGKACGKEKRKTLNREELIRRGPGNADRTKRKRTSRTGKKKVFPGNRLEGKKNQPAG